MTTSNSLQTAKWGKIVACHDEWPLSDDGFERETDARQYIENILDWFKGGKGGRFLIYSNDPRLTGERLRAAAQEARHSMVIDTSRFDLQTLLGYDGVFLSKMSADNQVLVDYVNAGGCVHVAGGTLEATQDAALWNTFLGAFKLSFLDHNAQENGVMTINSAGAHPIMREVNRLYIVGGTPIGLAADHPFGTQIVGHLNGNNVIAMVDVGLQKVVRREGAIEVTHEYRTTIKKERRGEGKVTIRNITGELTLVNVELYVDVDETDPNWSAQLCDAEGNYIPSEVMELQPALGPGESVSHTYYYYTEKDVPDHVPGSFCVTTHIEPIYEIKPPANQAAKTLIATAFKPPPLNDEMTTYPEPIKDKDAIITIENFQYAGRVAQWGTEAEKHIVRGTFKAKVNVPVPVRLSVGVRAEERNSRWETYHLDSDDQKTHANRVWYPADQTVAPNGEASFQYQYQMEGTKEQPDFEIELHILPRITVDYEGQSTFSDDFTVTD